MAGSKSAYLEKAILDHVMGGTTLAKPATIYVALSTAAYAKANTGSSFSEVVGGSYSRVALTNDATNFPAATGTAPASKKNGVAVTFPAATAGWGQVASFYILDAATGGNVLYGGDVGTAKNVLTGDTASFPINSLTVTEA